MIFSRRCCFLSGAGGGICKGQKTPIRGCSGPFFFPPRRAHDALSHPAQCQNNNSFYSAYESRVDVVVDLVYFTLGHLRRPGIVQVPRGTEESRGKEVASHDHLDGVKRNVMVVSELVEILSGEQRYLARKLERHMKTARSSNRRAFWYTLLEVGIAVGVGCAQIGVVRGWFKGGPTRITV